MIEYSRPFHLYITYIYIFILLTFGPMIKYHAVSSESTGSSRVQSHEHVYNFMFTDVKLAALQLKARFADSSLKPIFHHNTNGFALGACIG